MAFRRPAGRAKVGADKAGDVGAIYSAATALLAARDHAGAELEDKLRSKGFDRDSVATVAEELRDAGLVNDIRYAESFVRAHADRGQGPVRISMELQRKGLTQDLIEAALEAVPSWPAVAHDVRVRKFGRLPPTSWTEKGRQSRFLQYRGFSSDHIGAAFGSDFDPDLQLEDT